ncbi:Crp/Fnr family transcriptional regulator [Ensifer sp. SL37]|uniref:Crp/Fnr family transcriptional regulator n=1 Tax=Ensifer sp. SL37 TaxID=2995137 RepID=UPI00227616E3|nr:helix-turn-helix domain-containing protein [Ensifer sp. SL37]MCY1740966.1 helix-turn-helix domain-containing protein [Ensifer sp. SL37]
MVTPIATECCDLLFLSRAAIHEIVRIEPRFWSLFLIPQQNLFELAVLAVADTMLPSHLKRLIATLLRLGGARSGPAKDAPGRIDLAFSQEEIAVMTNVTRPTAGRALRRLAANGLIEVGYGRLTLTNIVGLQALLEE